VLQRIKLSDARLAALFLVSVCVLAFEIEVMRVFSVGSWSNFGSMVISIALLGFGVAGTLLTLLGRRIRENPDTWMASSAIALGPSMAMAHAAAQHIPFNPVLISNDPAQLWWIALYYVVYGVPFLAGGIFIGTVFTTLASRMHVLYFWNMLGSGIGGLLILGLMFLFPPAWLIFPIVAVAMLPPLLCSIRWSPREDRFRIRTIEAVSSVLLTGVAFVLLVRFGALTVSDFKPESYARKFPDSTLLYDSFSPLGEMRVFSSSYFHFAPGLSDNAGVAISRMPQNAFLGMYVDGNGPVGVMRKLQSGEERYLDFLPMSSPYLLLTSPRVLVLRLGGGAGVHTAMHNGAREIWVVESNPDLIRMLKDTPYFRSYTGGMLDDARVHLVQGEVRAFAGSTKERYDLVEIGLIDSVGLSQAGGYSVEENYTYTVEALQEYAKCLAPSGILSITVWDRLSPPRNVPRLLSTVVEMLRRQGVQHPEKRVFAFSLLLSTATVLVKNGDFSPAEIETLKEYCRRMSFDPDYYAGIPGSGKDFQKMLDGYRALYFSPRAQDSAPAATDTDLRPSLLYHNALDWLLSGRQKELFSKYVFDITAATDDKPYYSGYLKPETVPSFLSHAADISEEWGYLLLLGTFLQSLLFAALILILPLATRWRELFQGRCGTAGVILYYACLGLGYMMAEMFLIQKFVFFLADPVYANALVITILLISSGIGSLLSSRVRARQGVVVLAAVCGIVAFLVFAQFGLSPVLRSALGLPLALKAVIAALLIAPLGICLGVPFPAGLASLGERRRGILPWAWGVNGALSVAGSVLTRLISTSAGFTAVIAGVGILYVLAGLTFRANERG
jgi:spermidine synthase